MSPAQQRALRRAAAALRHRVRAVAARLRGCIRPPCAGRARDRLRHGRNDGGDRAAHPEIDFLGVEVHRPASGALLNRIDAHGLANVRVIRHDAVEVVDAHDRAAIARRRARVLPRSVAEEAPPQAAPAAARVRARARASGSRRAATCTSATDWDDVRATRSWRRWRPSRCSRNTADGFRAAPGVAAADQVRDARPASSATACATWCSATPRLIQRRRFACGSPCASRARARSAA